MKVLFIGGTGVISSAVSELAVKKGIDLYLLNRGKRADLFPGGAKLIKGDIRDIENIRKVLADYSFDVVVDWVAYTPEHIKADVDLFKGKTAQYIFISSASVYQKPPSYYLIDESTPLCNPYWQYARDKIACELLLTEEYREKGFPVTIVRPSYTYGKTMIPFAFNSREHRWTLVDRMRKGKKIIVPGDGTSLWTLTHNTDFAKGFIGLIGNMHAIGHAFHITSDEVLTWDQVAKLIGKAAGVEPNIIHISSDFICTISPEQTGGLLGDKALSAVFDNSKIKRFVPGFTSTVPFSEGIKETIAWYESDPARCTVDEEFNKLADKIIAAYESGLNTASLVPPRHLSGGGR
ncbi:MAG: SDR family oxidoreductase [Clostridiaceae bacterium]|nr:SDR family oxidoreductase [Clostridiaceae bacterium]